ncbi:unnamed protein product [Adineta ricciae]|uniref:ATP-dependent DNA helicase n=1 Tax=Adineta ricciae TaxID=249248 RepID=A0A814WJB2_ADIRI|nr:unnamed protein product [Adineta ricciae]
MNQFTIASKANDYEERISAIVASIFTDEKLVEPLKIIPSPTFDETKHTIDVVAHEYLKQASKAVQHLVPIKTIADGNCLFHSVVSFMPDANISDVELRVRTIVELVKNKTHYNDQCSKHVGPFNEALRRICNNNMFCELYELVALSNVLQCEVQSAYPYIDYRAEMKIMNAVYTPLRVPVPSNNKIVLFWSSTEDEISTRARPGNSGVWNPNHFVPLLQRHKSAPRKTSNESIITTPDSPQKSTVKNSQILSIRSPEFSPPSNARKHKSLTTTNSEITQFSSSQLNNAETNEQDEAHGSMDSIRMRAFRERESEDQRKTRIAYQLKRSASNRSDENEGERNSRLINQRKRSISNRSNENEEKRNARLTDQRKRSVSNRSNENEEERNARLTDQRKRSTANRLGKQISAGNKKTRLDQYQWPAAIETSLKEDCLQDFCDQTSMSVLRQSICTICNIRASASAMKEYNLSHIPNVQKLSCHADLIDVIGKITSRIAQDGNESCSIFCSLSDAVLYKKGYHMMKKSGNICHECHIALIKNKAPIFSVANKMWVGDVPLVLQQLTIAEEKLISLYRHNSCVIKLQSPFHHPSTAQTALKGNVITFMHDMPNIVQSLPLDVDDLCDTLKIVFIGAHVPNRVQLRMICGVSREKIRNALLWLKENNHMYRTIPVSEANIAKLPDDDVPESIWATIERIENMTAANAERAEFTSDPLAGDIIQDEPSAKTVIPMHTSAILDVNGTAVTSKDIGVHLLQKVKSSSTELSNMLDTSSNNADNEDVYIIPRSHMPVRDCYNMELFLGLFPTLFPYGYGAPYDSSRPTEVPLGQHIRYLLAYEDQRFEKHHSFMYVMFNMMQRRQACWNASLMASRPYFRENATDLQALTTKEVETALINATKHTFSSVTNPRINMLMKHIRAVGGSVMGSAYSRSALRSQIHSLIFNQGLPSIFMTINPADIHSRIALYFAGVDLDLDKILPEKIPSTYERAQIIAAHPVATARYFNVLISSILQCMVEKGLLGPIKAYFGTVENQGRGSLHLHILMWLDHDLTPTQLKKSVENEEFRNGLIGYLEDIIKQDLSNFTSDASSIDILENQQSITSDRFDRTDPILNEMITGAANENANRSESTVTNLFPSMMPTPKPLMSNFALYFKKDIIQLVCSSNIHKHTATCYKYSKTNTNPICRMRMPRRIEKVSSIDIESGEIKLKRLHETINNFNEYIISACRSNMDIKYIFSGSDAKALVYYITDYVTKSSLSFHDTFSLVLKAVESFEKQKLHIDASLNAEEKSRRLVLRCYNTLASQQELSGVQVASYLMGWPDHYTTHEFVNLFLIGIKNFLQATLTEAQLEHQHQTEDVVDQESEQTCMETEEHFLLQPDETKTKYVYVNARVDYQYRSAALDNMCLYDYMRFYRKKVIDAQDRKHLEAQAISKSGVTKNASRGRPISERAAFQSEHPQSISHINIRRMKPVIPVLLGPPIPRRDREDTIERYCRSILALFCPWRSFQDVCKVDQTWAQAFEARYTKITDESRKIIDNIQILQECKTDRDEHLQQVIEAAQTEVVSEPMYASRNDSDSDDENNEILDVLESIDMSEIPTLTEQGTRAEQIYFGKIVQAVDRANRFANIPNSARDSPKSLMYPTKRGKPVNIYQKYLIPATTQLIERNNKWQRQIKDEKERRRNACINISNENTFRDRNNIDEDQTVGVIDASMLANFGYNDDPLNTMYTLPVTKITIPSETSRNDIAQQFTLNKNQKAAFMIITGHLDGMNKKNEGSID